MIVEHRIDPDATLPESTRVVDAACIVGAVDHAILPVRTLDGRAVRALRTDDVRRAYHDSRADPELTVAGLVRDDLVVDSVAAGDALLERSESGGVLVADDASLVVRQVEPAAPVRTAVVMAGGLGTRLRPLTDEVPKPLLEVGGVPLLHRTLGLLARHGVERVFLSVLYLADRIEASIGDGSAFGVDVRYLREERPLDTGAGLAMLRDVDEPFYLLNGDVLTNVRLGVMARWHEAASTVMTVATHLYPTPLPYGVVHVAGGDAIVEIEEKPVFRYGVNAGMYLFSPAILDDVAHGEPLAMVDLIADLAAARRVGRFPLVEYWNDVGSHGDFERAQRDVEEVDGL